jgi:hypothetical protein
VVEIISALLAIVQMVELQFAVILGTGAVLQMAIV